MTPGTNRPKPNAKGRDVRPGTVLEDGRMVRFVAMKPGGWLVLTLEDYSPVRVRRTTSMHIRNGDERPPADRAKAGRLGIEPAPGEWEEIVARRAQRIERNRRRTERRAANRRQKKHGVETEAEARERVKRWQPMARQARKELHRAAWERRRP